MTFVLSPLTQTGFAFRGFGVWFVASWFRAVRPVALRCDAIPLAQAQARSRALRCAALPSI